MFSICGTKIHFLDLNLYTNNVKKGKVLSMSVIQWNHLSAESCRESLLMNLKARCYHVATTCT